MLSQLDHKIFSLDTIKDLYVADLYFKEVLEHCKEGKTWNKYVLNDGLLYHANKIYIPVSSVRPLLL